MNAMIDELRRRLLDATYPFRDYLLPAETAGCSAALLVLKWITHAYPEKAVRTAFQRLEWETPHNEPTEVVRRLSEVAALVETAVGIPEAGRVIARAVKDARIPSDLWRRYCSSQLPPSLGHCDRGELARLYLDVLTPQDEQSGRLLTPPSIVDLSYRLLAPQPGMTLHDLTCARGSWLLEAGRRTREIDGGLRPLAISGQELRFECVADARVALWLAGLPARVMQGNSLMSDSSANTGNSRFDRLYSHPPFGLTWESTETGRGAVGRRLSEEFEGCSANMAFVVRALSLLNEDGRAVVLNPLSSLSRRGGDEAVRRRLVESDVLEKIIQLPVGVFPGSTARACVLLLNRRKSTRQRGRVTFVDLSRQYAGTPNQSELTAIGIAQALAATEGSFVDGISITVDQSQIGSNDFDLEVRRYLSKSVWRGEPFAREWETYKQLLAERSQIESAVEDVLKKLGSLKTEDGK